MDNRFKRLNNFTPSAKYLELIAVSEKRKIELNLVGFNYRKLCKQKLRVKFGFELHHIIPNYRQKNIPVSERNAPDNIAILTIREHIIAHKELADFEEGTFKYKAKAAFLLQTNRCMEHFDGMSLPDDILEALSESRLSYYGSDEHILGSKKAGGISGLKRKERMKSDAEFRKKITDALVSSRHKAIESRRISLNNMPPWTISGWVCGDFKYRKSQYWEFYDTIYEGVVTYDLSYKILSKILSVPISRISNIVRIIKINSCNVPFRHSKFYSAFIRDFEPTLHRFEKDLEYFGNKEIPWTQHRPSKSMLLAEIGFEAMVASLNRGVKMERSEFMKVVGSVRTETYKLFELLQNVLDSGIYKLEDVWWYKYLERVYEYHNKS